MLKSKKGQNETKKVKYFSLKTILPVILAILIGIAYQSELSFFSNQSSNCENPNTYGDGQCQPKIPKCGDTLFYFSPFENKIILRILTFFIHRSFTPLDVFGKDLLGAEDENKNERFPESPLTLETKYGVKAYRICASCADYLHLIKPNIENGGSEIQDEFVDYCGENIYGHNETMTGVLFVPVNHTTKIIKSGDIHTAIWMHGWLSPQGPSEVLPNTSFGWFACIFETGLAFLKGGTRGAYSKDGKILLNELGALMLASRGMLVIAPDYLGYGNDKSLFKGSGIGRVYQTASMPLWFATKEKIQIESSKNDESTTVLDSVFIHGTSEGGMGVMPIGNALHKFGVNVVAYPASVPSYDFLKSMMSKMVGLMNDTRVPPVYYSWYGYGMAPFTHMSPHNDIAPEHSIASEIGEKELSRIVNSRTPFLEASDLMFDGLSSSPRCLIDGTGCPTFLNPILVENIVKVAQFYPQENTEYLPCQSKNTSPELSTLCKVFKSINAAPQFEAAEYPVKICHFERDNVAAYEDLPKKYPHNSNLHILPSQKQWSKVEETRGLKYLHGSSAFVCTMYAVLDIVSSLGI